MIQFNYQPETYFEAAGPTALLVKLTYPETQWGEEVSIYVNAMDGQLYYEAVDFYGNDFILNPNQSNEPLTLQELIVLIETMDVDKGEAGNAKSTLLGIPEAESILYPDLKSYFEEKKNSLINP